MHIKWGSSSKCVFACLSCDITHFSKKKGVLGGQLFQTKVSPPHLLAEVGGEPGRRFSDIFETRIIIESGLRAPPLHNEETRARAKSRPVALYSQVAQRVDRRPEKDRRAQLQDLRAQPVCCEEEEG